MTTTPSTRRVALELQEKALDAIRRALEITDAKDLPPQDTVQAIGNAAVVDAICAVAMELQTLTDELRLIRHAADDPHAAALLRQLIDGDVPT